MDRFIGLILSLIFLSILNLKSNMDRFIAQKVEIISVNVLRFKIQYG